MQEQFREILSELLGKFSGINRIVSVSFSVYSWSLNYRQIPPEYSTIFQMTYNIEVLFVLYYISQFGFICESV